MSPKKKMLRTLHSYFQTKDDKEQVNYSIQNILLFVMYRPSNK